MPTLINKMRRKKPKACAKKKDFLHFWARGKYNAVQYCTDFRHGVLSILSHGMSTLWLLAQCIFKSCAFNDRICLSSAEFCTQFLGSIQNVWHQLQNSYDTVEGQKSTIEDFCVNKSISALIDYCSYVRSVTVFTCMSKNKRCKNKSTAQDL